MVYKIIVDYNDIPMAKQSLERKGYRVIWNRNVILCSRFNFTIITKIFHDSDVNYSILTL